MIIDDAIINGTRIVDRSADVICDGARVVDGARIVDGTRVGDRSANVVGDGNGGAQVVGDGTTGVDATIIDGDCAAQVVGEGARVVNYSRVGDGDGGADFVRDCAGVGEKVVGVDGAIVDDLTVIGEGAGINQCNTRTNC